MGSNRYGIIRHGSIHNCKLKFPSPDARQDFAEKFCKYHASHDHDGDPPTFENASASDVAPAGLSVHDIDDVTIDGWATYEIEEYHEDQDRRYVSYEPPTCCVAPTLSLGDKTFIPSDTFQRHELSAIFGDMPDADYTSLLESVERGGFIENVIKLIDGAILDGWHRYRAAQDLNLLRKLRFQVWNTDTNRDGDPKAFVLARNIERRHLGASQRAQIAVAFNERFGHGGDRSESNVPDGTLKTRKELAEQANVGERTISRAVAVERAGQSEAVIAGEKTASEVLLEENRKKAHARAEKERRALWAAYNNDERFGDEDDPEGFTITASKAIGVSEMEGRFIYEAGKDEIDELSLETAETWGQRFRQIRRDIEAGAAWVVAYQTRSTKPEVITEVTLESLWEQVNAAIPKWKEKREGVGHASKTMLLHATLKFHSLPHDSETNVDILKKLLHLLSASTTDILEIFVRKQLRGESLWSTDDATVSVENPLEAESTETPEVLLESNRAKAQKANIEMWDAFEESPLSNHLDKDDFMEVAGKQYQCPTVFPDPMNMKRPEIWVCWFNAMKLSLEKTSEWVQKWLDEFLQDGLESFLADHYQEHRNWGGLSIDELSEEYNCAPSVVYEVMERIRKEYLVPDTAVDSDSLPLQDGIEEMKQAEHAQVRLMKKSVSTRKNSQRRRKNGCGTLSRHRNYQIRSTETISS